MNRIIVTGGAGFIGSNFIRHLARTQPMLEIVNVDKLTYAGNPANLAGLDHPGYRFEQVDILDLPRMTQLMEGADAVVNFAAESHVDNSIHADEAFIRTNVNGTHSLLQAARATDLPRFLQISTDEVYGSLERKAATEEDRLNPSSPYSASKAGADMLCLAYARTFGMDVRITRTVNNFGPNQHPEKLIPKTILYAASDQEIPVYGSGKQRRNWIHVEDNCVALDRVLNRGRPGEIYNIGGVREVENLALVRTILDIMGKPETLIRHVTDRPGHDFRYAVRDRKVRTLELPRREPFGRQLRKTVQWYEQNPQWCKSCKTP